MDQGGLIWPQAFPQPVAVQLFNIAVWPATFLIAVITLGFLSRSTIVRVSKEWADVVDRLPTQWEGLVTTLSTQWFAVITRISAQWAAAFVQASACLFSEAARNLGRGMQNAFGGVAARHFDGAVFGLLRMENAVVGLYAWQNQDIRRRLF